MSKQSDAAWAARVILVVLVVLFVVLTYIVDGVRSVILLVAFGVVLLAARWAFEL